ncbi:helix-turn-helix domain-containing protein [Fredinandcohnia sp. 179-A 10B2 NHS]|uniref:helix-turn-helix domain-containing protein n=1 Tax=Fredinandcohnia sp. 179-A 10B2 NHS TaxID=3235176 RepID=UPI0039A2F8B2
MNRFGENLKMVREQKNMTVQELALNVRVGSGTIEKYEKGAKAPDIQTLLRISTVLDVPASELSEEIYYANPTGIDDELEQLVKEVGLKKAKLLLRKAKEFDEADFLRAMGMLYDTKYTK